jgi:DNA ligase 1
MSMRRFVDLCMALEQTPKTTAKTAALVAYLRAEPSDDDKAWAVVLLCGARGKRSVGVRALSTIAAAAADIPLWLFEESYDAVGDLAETMALVLPTAGATRVEDDRPLSSWMGVVSSLATQTKEEQPHTIRNAWAQLHAPGRFIFNKLITGGFRMGVSQLLVQRALAEVAGVDVSVMADRTTGNLQPTAEQFRRWMHDDAAAPVRAQPVPFCLAHSAEDIAAVAALGDIHDHVIEPKYDGIRAQMLVDNGQLRLWSRGDEDITSMFLELSFMSHEPALQGATLDGELLAWQPGEQKPAPFHDLQKRLQVKAPSAALQAKVPVAFVAYDVIRVGGADVRAQTLAQRRALLEALPIRRIERMQAGSWLEVDALRRAARIRGDEGVMIKPLASAYVGGRTRGTWWKWKVDPWSVDAVLVYAQKGHGRRAGLYSDYTFAVWADDTKQTLVTFAKAYAGLSNAELKQVDAFIKQNVIEKFGPMRQVTPTLVMEIGFEGIAPSTRHKAGVAVRFPRMLRLRTDKQPRDADDLSALRALLGGT